MEPVRVPAGYYRAEGMVKNVNTIEEYRKLDKGIVLTQAARTVSTTSHPFRRLVIATHLVSRYGMRSTMAQYTLVRPCWPLSQ